MGFNDLRVEIHFYGKRLDSLGIIYSGSPQLPEGNPNILFFCLYTCAVLTNKKLTLAKAHQIMEKLRLGRDWESVFERTESRPFDMPVTLYEYLGVTRSVFRAQMLIDKDIRFQYGFSGFGMLSNGKSFNYCAENSVYGLMEKIYRLIKENPNEAEMLWQAAFALGNVDLGGDLRVSSRIEIAKRIHESVCVR